MYVFHKPDQHDQAMQAKKDGKWKPSTKALNNAKPNPTAAIVLNNSALKLSLSKSLQAVLVTKTGISEDQFNKIWSDACNDSGN